MVVLHEVGIDEFRAEGGKGFKLCGGFGERNARKINAQEFGKAGAVGLGMQDRVDVAEDLFGSVVRAVAGVVVGTEGGGNIFD